MMRIVCVIALLFVGFAHQAPVIRTSAGTVDVSQYVLPDGTLPIFCITDNDADDDGQTHGKMHMVHGCDACQIGASVLLPEPADATGRPMQFVASATPRLEMHTFFRPLFPPNTGPRAPPLTSQTA